MISTKAIATIKQTVPILQAHGEELTRLFYRNMFHNNPEVKVFFNQAHQHSGSQQKALAAAICAYAENIDNPAALASAVELIAQKHASLGIKAEHYPIVGSNLLASIRELLGDSASEDIIEAWAEAYQVLANLFIDREQQIYQQHEKQYGWKGFKPFTVSKVVAESTTINSYYLTPNDQTSLTPHVPGQYITVRIPTQEGGHTMRNYSLSNAPGTPYYRISVKRETTPENGYVSNYLHDQIQTGATVAVAPPCGEFILDSSDNKPIVFIAGGIGITPLLSMLHAAVNASATRPIYLIQAAVNGDSHAFEDELTKLTSQHDNLVWHVRYSDPSETDTLNHRFDSKGLIDEALVDSLIGEQSASYYLCGPKAMLRQINELLNKRHVAAADIHYEFFGPADALAA